MKTMIFCVLYLIILSGAYGLDNENQPVAPGAFIPATVREAGDQAWIDAYSEGLLALLDSHAFSPRALKAGALFCQNTEFPDNPETAALMVYDLLSQTDYLLRSGRPIGEIRVKLEAAWTILLARNAENIDLVKKDSPREKIKIKLTILGENPQTLPKDKDKVKKIDDKVKAKKDKLEKK